MNNKLNMTLKRIARSYLHRESHPANRCYWAGDMFLGGLLSVENNKKKINIMCLFESIKYNARGNYSPAKLR
jgi:hypothetical protein